MSEPVQSPLLTMLMGDSEVAVRSGLHSLIEAHSEFVLAYGDLKNVATAEIVHNGLSYILSIDRHQHEHSGLKSIFCNPDPASVGCEFSIRLGDHIAGGERVPAIVQGLLALARTLGGELGAIAIVWHPAKVVSGFAYFSEAVADYLAGGAFPVLPLVNFKTESDGSIHSTGLATFAGQELHAVNSNLDQIDMMRRVVRMVHDIAVNGPFQQSLELAGIDPGEILELTPEGGNALIRLEVRRNSEV